MFSDLAQPTHSNIDSVVLEHVLYQPRPGGIRALMARESATEVRFYTDAGAFTRTSPHMAGILHDAKLEVYLTGKNKVWVTDYIAEVPTLLRNMHLKSYTFPEDYAFTPCFRSNKTLYEIYNEAPFGLILKDSEAGYANSIVLDIDVQDFARNSFQVFNSEYDAETNSTTLYLVTDDSKPFNVIYQGVFTVPDTNLVDVVYLPSDNGPQHAALL